MHCRTWCERRNKADSFNIAWHWEVRRIVNDDILLLLVLWGGAPICLFLSTRRLPFQLHSFILIHLLVTSLVSRTSPQAFLAASLNYISSCPTTSLPILGCQWVTATLDRDRFWIRTIALKFKIVMSGQFSTLAVFFESLRHTNWFQLYVSLVLPPHQAPPLHLFVRVHEGIELVPMR